MICSLRIIQREFAGGCEGSIVEFNVSGSRNAEVSRRGATLESIRSDIKAGLMLEAGGTRGRGGQE